MDNLLKIKSIIEEVLKEGGDAQKFYDRQVKVAGPRIRRAMKEIKELAHAERLQVSRIKKEFSKKDEE